MRREVQQVALTFVLFSLIFVFFATPITFSLYNLDQPIGQVGNTEITGNDVYITMKLFLMASSLAVFILILATARGSLGKR
jgi:hypothetical protein